MVNLRVLIRKDKHHNKVVTIWALSDTGASIDCDTERFEKKHSLIVTHDKANKMELIATEGNVIKITGTTKLTLQIPGGGWTTTVALMCPKLSHYKML